MGYDHILLAIGPDDRGSSDALVDAAIDLAEPADTVVHLLYIFPRDDYETLMEQMDIDTATSGLTPDEVAERHESVREPADRLESMGIDHEISGVSDTTPSEQVIQRIRRTEADVVVVGGARRSPAGKAVFGDRAQQILLKSPVPVLFVRRA
jgi:nucleotide-binding universal stress UspA family protein